MLPSHPLDLEFVFKNSLLYWAVVARAFNPSTPLTPQGVLWGREDSRVLGMGSWVLSTNWSDSTLL